MSELSLRVWPTKQAYTSEELLCESCFTGVDASDANGQMLVIPAQNGTHIRCLHHRCRKNWEDNVCARITRPDVTPFQMDKRVCHLDVYHIAADYAYFGDFVIEPTLVLYTYDEACFLMIVNRDTTQVEFNSFSLKDLEFLLTTITEATFTIQADTGLEGLQEHVLNFLQAGHHECKIIITLRRIAYVDNKYQYRAVIIVKPQTTVTYQQWQCYSRDGRTFAQIEAHTRLIGNVRTTFVAAILATCNEVSGVTAVNLYTYPISSFGQNIHQSDHIDYFRNIRPILPGRPHLMLQNETTFKWFTMSGANFLPIVTNINEAFKELRSRYGAHAIEEVHKINHPDTVLLQV